MNTKNVNKPERLFVMKKFLLAVMALPLTLLAAEESLSDRVDGLQAQFDRVMSRAGIHFNGEFRSQFLSSTVSGDAMEDDAKKREGVEYTSVDFDVVARPNTALSARAVFRLHQDWRNFFSDVQNPITTRWLSIDGSLMNGIVGYNLGDYRKKLTPLTLWAEDIDMLFEPEIFAQNRRFAMAESFLGNNERALQGGNLTFSAELYPLLHRLEADVFGARLSVRGTGESAVTAPGVDFFDANFDRYLVGANLAAKLSDGTGLGASFISIYDAKGSFRGDELQADLNATSHYVIAGRLNADNGLLMDDEFVNVGIGAEVAFSDNKWSPRSENNVAVDTNVTGLAMNFGLTAKLNLGEEDGVRLKATYIMNDSLFRNDAAQSPTFMQNPIINNENGLSGLGLMNPFDAMYRSVFKYAPSQYYGGTLPYKKTGYNNSILKPEEVARVSANPTVTYPSLFQAALPGGLATADRAGIVADLCGKFLDNGVNIGAKFALLTSFDERSYGYSYFVPDLDDDIDVKIGSSSAEYMEFVGGASVDIAKFAPVVGPSLVVGGSFGMYTANNVAGAITRSSVGLSNTESMLISAELRYQFHQRFALLGGLQLLTSTVETINYAAGGEDKDEREYTFSNMAAGLSYKVADGGTLTFKLAVVNGEGPIDAFNAETGEVYRVTKDYQAFQPELFLTVKF